MQVRPAIPAALFVVTIFGMMVGLHMVRLIPI